VTTEAGTFTAENEPGKDYIRYSGYGMVSGDEPERRVKFFLLRSQFKARNAGRPAYWVLPLQNYLTQFGPIAAAPEVNEHPLMTGADKRAITFAFGGTNGFIAPLPDYDATRAALLDGTRDVAITSLAVGKVAGRTGCLEELSEWLPCDMPLVLSLASGSEVRVPWTEIRDEEGRLIERHHAILNFVSRGYVKGNAALDEVICGGTGSLLSAAFESPHFSKSALRVALKHCVRAGLRGHSLEDQASHVCRGLECLCKAFELREENLLTQLPGALAKSVKEILTEARGSIGKIPTESEKQRALIEKIVSRLANVANQARDFGAAVIALVEEMDLNDAAVMANFGGPCSEKTNDYPREWRKLVSYCRNVVAHGDWFQQQHYQRENIQEAIQHLRDILTRTLLKMMLYKGSYTSPLSSYQASLPVDWVTKMMLPSQLGYSCR